METPIQPEIKEVSPVNVPVSIKFKPQWLIISLSLISILAVGSLIALAIWFYQTIKHPVTDNLGPFKTQVAEISQNWQVFTSQDQSFSFEHPSDWLVQPTEVFGSRSVTEFRLQNNPILTASLIGNYNQLTGKPYQTLAEFLGETAMSKSTVSSVAGVEAVKTIEPGDGGHITPAVSLVIFSPDKKSIIQLIYNSGFEQSESAGDPFEKIGNSFKFIQNSISDVELQTYLNPDYSYSLSLPKLWKINSANSDDGSCQAPNLNPSQIEFSSLTTRTSCSYGDYFASDTAEIIVSVGAPYDSIALNDSIAGIEKINFAGEIASRFIFNEKTERPAAQATKIIFNHKGLGYRILVQQSKIGVIYDQKLAQILATFKFSSKNLELTQFEAVELVKNLPEVKNYLIAVPSGIVNYDHLSEDGKDFVIQVYEVKDGHTATFNWFNVNIKTKKITKMFDFPQSSEVRIIKLYYHDNVLDPNTDLCQANNSVEATIPKSTLSPIKDALNELIKSDLIELDSRFYLISLNLKPDGTLILQFPEVPGFTTGGSCRIGILTTQIEKTALQFPEVKKVVFQPEVFQP